MFIVRAYDGPSTCARAGGAQPPVSADLHGLRPLLIQVGSPRRCWMTQPAWPSGPRRLVVDVTLEVWEDMIHVWQPFAPIAWSSSSSLANVVEDNSVV